MPRLARHLVSLVAGLAATAFIVLALATIVLPRVLGWVPLTILTGSMEPTVPTGSQVVVEPVEGAAAAAALRTGAVITFMPHAEDSTLVTHRIVGESRTADGEVTFTTQGDANGAPDPWAVTATQIRGEVRYHVPYAGYVATALDAEQKSTGVTVLAVTLLGYAGWSVVSAARGRSRRAEAVAA